MSKVSWFKAHRKQVLTHTMVVGAFLVFLFFLSEPLFSLSDRYQSEDIPGESQLVDISVPTEAEGIKYWFESIVTATTVEFLGWAFIEHDSPKDSTTYLVFNSSQATYVFKTDMQERSQLNKHLGIEEPDVTEAGFVATIPAEKMENGAYTIGIYISKGETEALEYTDRLLITTNKAVEVH